MRELVLKGFVSRHRLEESVSGGDNLVVLYHLGKQKLVYYHVFDESYGLHFKDIIRTVSDVVYWKFDYTSVYVGEIVGDNLVVNISFNSQFLQKTILHPDHNLIVQSHLNTPEVREYVMQRINDLLSSGDVDFITINMLTRYFMIDRSNLSRFRTKKDRSLGIERSVFVLNFLNRVVTDLTWGEIKKLILLNCENDALLRKALKMNKINIPLSTFYRIISTRHDLSLSVAILKNVLATYMYLSDGQQPPTRKSYEYPIKLNPTEENSFTYTI